MYIKKKIYIYIYVYVYLATQVTLNIRTPYVEVKIETMLLPYI